MVRKFELIPSSVRSVPPILLVLAFLVVAGSTTAVAITITDTNPTQVSIFSSESEESDFDTITLDTNVRGIHNIHVDVELENTADTPQGAEVTVQLLDEDGEVIAEEVTDTGSVEAAGTWGDRFMFNQHGLADEYDETVVIVNQ